MISKRRCGMRHPPPPSFHPLVQSRLSTTMRSLTHLINPHHLFWRKKWKVVSNVSEARCWAGTGAETGIQGSTHLNLPLHQVGSHLFVSIPIPSHQNANPGQDRASSSRHTHSGLSTERMAR